MIVAKKKRALEEPLEVEYEKQSATKDNTKFKKKEEIDIPWKKEIELKPGADNHH